MNVLKPLGGRQLVAYLRTMYRISLQRACDPLQLDRSSYHYQHRRPPPASLRKGICELSNARVKYRYRRIHILLSREGGTINHKRTQLLYCEEGLHSLRKTPTRTVLAKRRADRIVAAASNDCWSMVFLSDELLDGRKVRISTIVDNLTRVLQAIDVWFSYRGANVVTTLPQIAQVHGRPKRIAVDNAVGVEAVPAVIDDTP